MQLNINLLMSMAINVYYVISIAETASKKIEALIRSMKFFLLRLLCISINLWNYIILLTLKVECMKKYSIQ